MTRARPYRVRPMHRTARRAPFWGLLALFGALLSACGPDYLVGPTLSDAVAESRAVRVWAAPGPTSSMCASRISAVDAALWAAALDGLRDAQDIPAVLLADQTMPPLASWDRARARALDLSPGYDGALDELRCRHADREDIDADLLEEHGAPVLTMIGRPRGWATCDGFSALIETYPGSRGILRLSKPGIVGGRAVLLAEHERTAEVRNVYGVFLVMGQDATWQLSRIALLSIEETGLRCQ